MRPGGDIEIFTALCLLSDAVGAVLDARQGSRRHHRALVRLASARATVAAVTFCAPLRLEALDEAEWRRRVRLLNVRAGEFRRWVDDQREAEHLR